MGRFVSYNANPLRNQVGDCVVRSIAKIEGKSWDEVYAGVCLEGAYLGDMPTANAVWGSYLKRLGYKRTLVDKEDCSVVDYCGEHPTGAFILALPSHVVACCDGRYFDTWDCGSECVLYVWQKEVGNG